MRRSRGGGPSRHRLWPIAGGFLARSLTLAGVVLLASAGAALADGSAPAPSAAPPNPRSGPNLPARLQALLDGLVAGEPGVRSALLLVDGPGIHWEGASGIAIADSAGAIVASDQFVIDSIAKMLTATIAMKLVEEGKLSLDEPVAPHLADSLVRGLHVYEGRDDSREITVRQLLNHTSGIVDDWRCADFLDLVASEPERRWRPEETIQYVKAHCPPAFAPGNGFHYSDTGYNVLGLVLESHTARPLHRLYREMLLDPLGMEHTYRPAYEPPRPVLPGRRPAERYLEDLECALWPSVTTADWAGGGLVSTTRDLTRFLRAFVDGGIFAESSSKAAMLTWVESGPHNNYGLGVSRVLFERFDDPAVAALGEVWGHSGSSHNFMYYWPAQDITMVGTLNQMAVETDLYEIVARIMQTILAARQPAGPAVR